MLLGICPDPPSPAAGCRMPNAAPLWERWPALTAVPPALAWLSMRADLGLAHRSTDAYARGFSEFPPFLPRAAARSADGQARARCSLRPPPDRAPVAARRR